MKPERWQNSTKLFHAALKRAPNQRAAFLDGACAGHDSLRKQIEALGERPAANVVAIVPGLKYI